MPGFLQAPNTDAAKARPDRLPVVIDKSRYPGLSNPDASKNGTAVTTACRLGGDYCMTGPSSPHQPLSRRSSPALLTGCLCLAEVAGMAGAFSFPALLPHFKAIWGLSASQAGWINGIYFAGYTLAVPLLTSLTDRIDARRIYLISCCIGIVANLGFALAAIGFWSALIFRVLCGFSLAGTFIPGLKALIDRLPEDFHHRGVSFYTASFGLGMSVSFYITGTIFTRFGWKAAFGAAAAGSLLALVLALIVLVPRPIPRVNAGHTGRHVLDFRPVWHNQASRTYIIAYMAHMWEMFAARSWLVAFMTFSISLRPDSEPFMTPTTVMAIAGIGGMMASIAGGEMAVRFPRGRVVSSILGISFLFSVSIGFVGMLPYYLLVPLIVVYTLFFQGDSAAIHAGVITSANPEIRGATMALQSLGGFAAASAGSIVAGWVLGLTGEGQTHLSWGLTFASMGLSAGAGSFLVLRSLRGLKP